MNPIINATQRNIGGCQVLVKLGDITQDLSAAYVVPQFTKAVSYGGVGGAVCRGGAGDGLEEYQKILDLQGERNFGEVFLTPSHGGNSKYLIHAVTVGSGREHEFEIVHTAMLEALKTAEQFGLESVSAPALGTGIVGNLTAEQSAQAMLSAIDRFAAEGGKIKVNIVIYGDRDALGTFSSILNEGRFDRSAESTVGQKEFDLDAWIAGMQKDWGVNILVSELILVPKEREVDSYTASLYMETPVGEEYIANLLKRTQQLTHNGSVSIPLPPRTALRCYGKEGTEVGMRLKLSPEGDGLKPTIEVFPAPHEGELEFVVVVGGEQRELTVRGVQGMGNNRFSVTSPCAPIPRDLLFGSTGDWPIIVLLKS